jgi:predicted Zn-dependent protease
LLPTLLCALAHADAVGQPGLTAARLLAAAPHELERLLEDARPAPLPLEARQRVLAALPREGEVTAFDPRRARKVSAVTDLLSAWSGREPHALKIVDAPQAAVALHERSVVLITVSALDLLSEEEVTAVVAHELGHEYTWRDWVDAKARGDGQRLREIELVSDLIAVVTLHRTGKPASLLVNALEKLTQRNLERFGASSNERDYPSLSQRRKAIREFARQLAPVVNARR